MVTTIGSFKTTHVYFNDLSTQKYLLTIYIRTYKYNII